MTHKSIYFPCDDSDEIAVFTKHTWRHSNPDYELSIEDSYCGGDYKGIRGRFKRAWSAFWAKPISYTGVECDSGERMKKFLQDCLDLIEDSEV